MNKGFWKGLIYGFVGTIPLYLILNVAFWILQNLGILEPGKNPTLVIVAYAVVILIYFILILLYFRNQSSQNLEKLKKEVEQITGRKLS